MTHLHSDHTVGYPDLILPPWVIGREFPQGAWVNAHEVTAGVVYNDANVTVTAFTTRHAMESYGYRFDTSTAAS